VHASPSLTTTYTVSDSLTGFKNFANVIVNVNPLPHAIITPAGSTTFCEGGNVVLNSNTGAQFNYQWLNGSGVILGQTTSKYTATKADDYKVIITQSNCTATSNHGISNS